mgnify:CR=1 FL=1|tara:strand:- start:5522 stop:5758 length:237 start_codon:yes stop_codon:yes gene_type:complete
MKDYQVVLKTELKGEHSIELYIKAYSVEQIVDQLGDDYYIVEIEEWKVDATRRDGSREKQEATVISSGYNRSTQAKRA